MTNLLRFPTNWISRTLLAFGLAISVPEPSLADDLFVKFEETPEGVHLYIDSCTLPEQVDDYAAGALTPMLSYTSVTSEPNTSLYITNVVGESEVGRGVFLWEDTTVDFSKLKDVNVVPESFGDHSGIRIFHSEEEGKESTFQGRFFFLHFDSDTRVATFNMHLFLEGESFSTLFVDNAFADGPFTVWSSEHFSVKFEAIPEASTVGMLASTGALLVAGGAFRRFRR